jgi:hypothetical protein
MSVKLVKLAPGGESPPNFIENLAKMLNLKGCNLLLLFGLLKKYFVPVAF